MQQEIPTALWPWTRTLYNFRSASAQAQQGCLFDICCRAKFKKGSISYALALFSLALYGVARAGERLPSSIMGNSRVDENLHATNRLFVSMTTAL